MIGIVRAILIAIGIYLIMYAIGLFLQQEWATSVWLWPDAPPLSNIFISSMSAGVGAALFWVGYIGEIGAAAGGGLALLISGSGMAIYLFQETERQYSETVSTYATLFAILAIVGLLLYLFARRIPICDPRQTPPVARWSILIFSIVLAFTSFQLLQSSPYIFPWPLATDMSVIYGWMFTGALILLVHSVIWPNWQSTGVVLISFLVYDIILIAPYLAHINNVKAAHVLSLTSYLIVIIYSFVLCVYYLFIDAETGLWGKSSSTIAEDQSN